MNRRRALMIQQAQGGQGGGSGGLPGEYTQLSYLQSNGNAYLNIDYPAKTTLKAEMETTFNLGNRTGTFPLFGCRDASYVNAFAIWRILATYNTRFDIGDTYNNVSRVSDGTHIFIKDGTKNYVDGEMVIENAGSTITNGLPLYLFAINQAGTPRLGYNGTFNYFKLWDSDILVRDLLPAMRNSDNALGMYDAVNHVFYTNAGTGAFTGGEPI